MREHGFSFEIDASSEEVWKALHPRLPPMPPGERRVIEHGDVRIEIVHPGDADGLGLVRQCRFRVPRYLLTGGVARSWEVITESRPNEYSRYEAINPLARRFLEARVHRFISRDNDVLIRTAVEQGVAARRARAARR